VPRAPSLTTTLVPLGQPEKAMGHESQIELWSPNLTTFCFAGIGTDRLRREQAMKTAGRENPNRWARAPRNRAHGAAGQNRSRSIKWAAKQEKFQPREMCFFLPSTFIERSRKPLHTRWKQWRPRGGFGNRWRPRFKSSQFTYLPSSDPLCSVTEVVGSNRASATKNCSAPITSNCPATHYKSAPLLR
jgi:hypothetical protein